MYQCYFASHNSLSLSRARALFIFLSFLYLIIIIIIIIIIITPWGTVLLEKLIVTQLLKKLPAF